MTAAGEIDAGADDWSWRFGVRFTTFGAPRTTVRPSSSSSASSLAIVLFIDDGGGRMLPGGGRMLPGGGRMLPGGGRTLPDAGAGRTVTGRERDAGGGIAAGGRPAAGRIDAGPERGDCMMFVMSSSPTDGAGLRGAELDEGTPALAGAFTRSSFVMTALSSSF